MGNLAPLLENFLKQAPLFQDEETLSIEEIRQQLAERYQKFNENVPTFDLSIHDQTILTSYGETGLRIYRPKIEGLASTLIFFHGGGFVFGNLDSLDRHCREIANSTQCMVISVTYPLAPENPFPAAPECAYAATQWIYEHLNGWLGDPNRCFIGGSSAGANLAAVVCLMAKDRNGPKLAGQILLCPMTDVDFNTPSYLENASGYLLTRDKCIWFISQYASDIQQYHNPLLAPLHAKDVKGLPKALVITAEFDPLRDEGIAYAEKLHRAGVSCQNICYTGMIHGFSTLPLDLPEKRDVLARIKDFIQPNHIASHYIASS